MSIIKQLNLQSSFFAALGEQSRIVHAIVLREVHTLYGQSKFGFLLTMLQIMCGVGFMMGIRYFTHLKPPHGMGGLLWLLTAYFVFNIFTDTMSKCMTGVGPNKPLLSFPQVHVMDIMIARALSVVVVQIATFGVFGLAYYYIIEPVALVRPWFFLLGLFYTVPLGLGIGLCFSAVTSFFPGFQIVGQVLNRILFFTSGLIFPIDSIKALEPIAYYNPLVQILDMMRMAFSRTYVGMDFRFGYLISFSLIVLFIGLAVERVIHKKMEF